MHGDRRHQVLPRSCTGRGTTWGVEAGRLDLALMVLPFPCEMCLLDLAALFHVEKLTPIDLA